ncbi:MAG: lipopolysaccharide transport periplasmic protein LptA [Succinivibrio sp.]|nr:lipopolysaccharide transport periplasmic protein LptA [Succinivibrio sp.]
MSSIIQTSLKLALCLSLCNIVSSWALSTDKDQPIHIESKEQLADMKANKVIFSGSVKATQGSIELLAEKAELTRDASGELKSVQCYGKPVTFKQVQDNGKTIRSQSSVLEYLPLQHEVILSGKATIWQDGSHVDGERIVYNLKTEKMKASNANTQDGRVHSTFMPSDFNKKKK